MKVHLFEQTNNSKPFFRQTLWKKLQDSSKQTNSIITKMSPHILINKKQIFVGLSKSQNKGIPIIYHKKFITIIDGFVWNIYLFHLPLFQVQGKILMGKNSSWSCYLVPKNERTMPRVLCSIYSKQFSIFPLGYSFSY